MTYFLVFAAALAVIGLAAVSVAEDIGLSLFGYGLFGFGVIFALFLVKRHFDHLDGSARP